jgi:hypothetical protein
MGPNHHPLDNQVIYSTNNGVANLRPAKTLGNMGNDNDTRYYVHNNNPL